MRIMNAIRRNVGLSCLVLAFSVPFVLTAGGQEIKEVPPGHARFLVMMSRGLGDQDDSLHRTVRLEMRASDGTRLTINIPEVHSLDLPFRDDQFVDYVLMIRRRLRVILRQRGYTIERETVYRREGDEDIIAVDALEIGPPPDVKIVDLDFEVRTPPNAEHDAVEFAVFLEYQAYVEPNTNITGTRDWELY